MKRTIICYIYGLLLCTFLGAQEKTNTLSPSLKDKIFQSIKSIDLWVTEMSIDKDDDWEYYSSSNDSYTSKGYECFTLKYDLSGNYDLVLEGKDKTYRIKHPFIDITRFDEYGKEFLDDYAPDISYGFFDRENPDYSISIEGSYDEDLEWTTWKLYVDNGMTTIAKYSINNVCFYDGLDKLIAKYNPCDELPLSKGQTFQRMIENLTNSYTDLRYVTTKDGIPSGQRQRALSSSKQLRLETATIVKNGNDVEKPEIQNEKATLAFGYSSNCDLLFKTGDLNVLLPHPMKSAKYDRKEATDGYDGPEYLFHSDGNGYFSIMIIKDKDEVYPQFGWYNKDGKLVNAYGIGSIDFYDTSDTAIVLDYSSESDGNTESTNLFWSFVERMYNLYK